MLLAGAEGAGSSGTTLITTACPRTKTLPLHMHDQKHPQSIRAAIGSAHFSMTTVWVRASVTRRLLTTRHLLVHKQRSVTWRNTGSARTYGRVREPSCQKTSHFPLPWRLAIRIPALSCVLYSSACSPHSRHWHPDMCAQASIAPLFHDAETKPFLTTRAEHDSRRYRVASTPV